MFVCNALTDLNDTWCASSLVDTYQRLRDGAWPWSRHWQSAVGVAVYKDGSSDRSSDHVRRWSRRSFHIVRTTATHCFTASLKVSWAFCSLSRMRCTSGVGRSTLRPNHASATGAALASGSTSGGFQSGHPGLPVTVWHGSSLSSRRLPVSDEGRHQLRSATSRTCVLRRTYSNYGDRCFAAAGPCCGTAFQLNCDKLTITFNDLSGY